jgi:hypothetical protein
MRISQVRAAFFALSTFCSCSPTIMAYDGAGKVTTRATPGGGKPVMAKTDKAGAIHLLYDSEDGPKYSKSTDGGVTFGPAIPVVSGVPQSAGLEFAAWDMALGKGGRVHVAMGTNAWKLKLPQEEWGCFYASLDSGSSAFSPVRNINRKPSEGFSLAADDDGKVTACWLSDKLYANVSHDNGETFAPYVEIDRSYNPCNCCTTSAAYGEEGRLAVLYREETDNDRDMYLVLWDQVQGRTTRKRVGRTAWKIDACPMTYFTVTSERRGFVAVWPTKGQIYFGRLDGQGNASGQAEIKTPGRSGMRTGVLALTANDGNTLVAWKKDGQTSWQLFDADGSPSRSTGSVESRGNGLAGVVGKDGRFILFR